MKLLPNDSRADAAKTLIKVTLFVYVTFCLLNIFYINLAYFAIRGEVLPYETVTLVETFTAFVAVIHLIVFILSALTFIQWFRRAYFNLHLQNISRLRWKEGWAAGAWFVPIISLYVPYQIMKDIWSATLDKIKKHHLTSEYPSDVIGWWWAAFLISNILSNIYMQLEMRGVADSPEGFLNLQFLDLFSNCISIAGAILTVKMIRIYTEMESKMHDIIEEESESNQML